MELFDNLLVSAGVSPRAVTTGIVHPNNIIQKNKGILLQGSLCNSSCWSMEAYGS